jgi:ATP-binding cassette, subfamily C, bacterial PrsD
LEQWDPDELGRHVGYLPQDVALFDGTVADNIARLEKDAASNAILSAARLAGAHEMILRLPDGYATRIGERGSCLSAGQRQRIGLARAVFGDPFLVVLDEPNSNLDGHGEMALVHAIAALRNDRRIVVMASHRPNAIAALDTGLVLYDGRKIAFGPREEIFARLAQSAGTSIKQSASEASLSRAKGSTSR